MSGLEEPIRTPRAVAVRRVGHRTPVLALAALVLTFAVGCGATPRCSVLVECTCHCTNGTSGQVSGRACVEDQRSGSCDEWAAEQRPAAENSCLASCVRAHGDASAQCQFAVLPGNPVVTVNGAACGVSRRM